MKLKINFDQVVYPMFVGKYGKRSVVVCLQKIPDESSVDEVRAALRRYGQVLNMRRKMFEGDDFVEVATGRASALMYIESHIPPAIMINQEEKIVYPTMANPSFVSYATTTTMMLQTTREKTRTRERVQQEKATILGERPG
jgi:hypothetical protein